MMALPTDLPFWEVARGGGPLTDWNRARQEALDKGQDRKLRVLDPRVVSREEVVDAEVRVGLRRRRNISSRKYRERRALGLCQTCEAPSPDTARCELCRSSYNLLPCRERLRKGCR